MPIHDWSRVNAGLFHHFHHGWTASLSNALNSGRLPPGYFALSEQVAGGPIPDVLTLQSRPRLPKGGNGPRGLAAPSAPPRARFVLEADVDEYAARANRISIRHPLGHVVAVVEIVSPGNKASRTALRAFVEKTVDFLRQGIHLLIVDLFPASVRDPQGIHKAIWDEIQEEPFELPADKPLTVVAYSAGPPTTACVEPVAVGDVLPEMPIFLDAGNYVQAPLLETCEATWSSCPDALKEAVEGTS